MELVRGFFVSLPYFIILIGLLVFVHEGGHFVLAKVFKVKVHVFSLGFGPKLLGFQKGETLYKIGLVPIGGYVKMLGEDPSEEVEPEDRGRAFSDKPPWQRLLILIGGPAMNLIFPLFLHFGVGLGFSELLPAEVGVVLPGMPAYEAGLRPGDVIKAIDGQEIHSFDEVVYKVAPRPGQKIAFTIQRGDDLFERTIEPRPTEIPVILEERETIGVIGIRPDYEKPLVGVAGSDSAAFRAGLRSFDFVESVNRRPVERFVDLERMLTEAAGSKVDLSVKSMKADAKPPFEPLDDYLEPGARSVSLEVPAGVASLRDLGIESSADFVAYVAPEGAAERVGLRRGDRIVSLDGNRYEHGQIFMEINRKPDKERLLAWTRDGVEHKGMFKPDFIPAGKAGDLGVKRDAYDSGFWSVVSYAKPVLVPNRSLFTHAVKYSLMETAAGFRVIALGFKMLFEGTVSMRALGGPIMIGQLAGMAGQEGVSSFFWMMALISLNLGLLNLVPIPILDGGQIVLLGIEAMTRRPISRVIRERVMIAGLAMILVLMVFATWNDIARLVVG